MNRAWNHDVATQAATPAETAALVLRRCKLRPVLGIVLGSGFQPILSQCTAILEIDFSALPGFPRLSVMGHVGKLVLGYLQKTPVVILGGRGHYYEGHSMQQATFPIRVLAELGVRTLLLTNAAGGINPDFAVGDFMAISDHINFMGDNPLFGPLPLGERRFVDMHEAYNKGLRRILAQAAKEAGLKLHEGVYLAVGGPSYETPAEIKAFAALGAHAVGMGTVPEVIVARQCGLKVAAVSCITNLAAGRSAKPISHDEVLETGRKTATAAADLLGNFARLYGQRH